MTQNFRPMLAAKLAKPKFPYLASPKLDGIRCLIMHGCAVSRTLKPLPNHHIRAILSQHKLTGLDGEVIVGNPTDSDVFKKTSSAVMSHNQETDFQFHVFDDYTDPAIPFDARLENTYARIARLPESIRSHITFVSHELIENEDQLNEYESRVVEQGCEGVMLRDPGGRYKYGRSTVKDNILLKLKRFSDSEAVVIGFDELLTNNNPKETSELGLTKRATKQEFKTEADTLGSLIVKDILTDVEFNIGTGFTQEERDMIWHNRNNYQGRQLTYKYFEVGTHDKPRHPVFVGWRPSQI